ncbi:hypothetical protein BS47DRAFT_1365513 [Hydnum rufescens UP504]|uniref:Uncharacterized protein n=1 Tax=Hydnum rufescens UP504 TaxID=1448309 RepID=A0A9P6ANI9_9AGAM|nr:hypothetical protein BS47DRAFT_1365513 [Hydnum rufescens UP504]
MKRRPANDGWPAKTQTEPHTRFGGCVVALRYYYSFLVPSLRENPPDEDTDEPPVRAATQAQSARPPKRRSTKPCATHPLRRVCGNIRSLPYVKTHPTTIWTSPQYTSQCAATQASSAHPPNTTIDEIAYHTPAAAGCTKAPKEQQKLLFCAKIPAQKRDVRSHPPPATRNPIQEPSARTPATYATTDEIRYHTPAAAGLPSMHETPPNKNTANFQDEKEMCAATRNPIPEPATAGQNEYHTRFGGCGTTRSSRNDDSPQRRPATRPNDPPTVNRRASLPPMATNEPAEPPIKQRKAPHTP